MIRPTRQDPACHPATTARTAETRTDAITFSQSIRRYHAGRFPPASPAPAMVPWRRTSSGFTRRTSSSGTEREEQRHQQADRDPLESRGNGQPVRRGAERRGKRRRDRRDRQAGEQNAEAAARERQDHDLHEVRREHLTARRPEALQHGDAAQLLVHEHARDAPDPDAPQDHHGEADEAEVVLRALEVFADVLLGCAVPAHVHEPVAELLAQPFDQVARLALAFDPEEDRVARPAAERQQARGSQIVVGDDGARAEAERAGAVPRLFADDAADLELRAPEEDLVPFLEVELSEELGPDERAVIAEEIVGVRTPSASLNAPYSGNAGCTPRSSTILAIGFRSIAGLRHRRGLDRLGPLAHERGSTGAGREAVVCPGPRAGW